MVDVAVFASGKGSNFERLVKAQNDDGLNYNIKLLITDKASAGANEKAESLGVKLLSLNPKSFSNKNEYERYIVEVLKEERIEFIALAGYMRIIGEDLLSAFENRIINIHPAYLPEFPGKSGIEDAYEAKVSHTGVTIHYVDRGVDTGEVIYQERVEIESHWELDELRENIHRVEHRIYPMVLDRVCREFAEKNS